MNDELDAIFFTSEDEIEAAVSAFDENEIVKCDGVVYRANVSFYQTKNGFASTVRLNKLFSKSCQHLECDWFDEDLNILSGNRNNPIEGMCDVEHGKLYKLSVCNVHKDWETGWVDEYDLELVEVKDE